MNTFISSIFSPRKVWEDLENASPPPRPKSVLSNKRLPRKSLTETQIKTMQDSRYSAMTATPSKSPKIMSPTKSATTKSATKSLGRIASQTIESAVRAPRFSTPNLFLSTTEESQESQESQESAFEFRRLVQNRWRGDKIEIQVEWEDGDLTWEDEATLHQDAPEALLEYWEKQGGRPLNPHNPDLFNIHVIRKHGKNRKQLLVEWVGYGPKDATWLPRLVVEEAAPDLAKQYWASLRPGRPRQRRRRLART